MIGALTVLVLYQLVGETLSWLLDLPIPGPVIGMVLLFLTLLIRRGVPDGLRTTTTTLMQNLSILFVPAGAGLIAHAALLEREWPAIVTAIFVSTLVTMALVALLVSALKKRKPA